MEISRGFSLDVFCKGHLYVLRFQRSTTGDVRLGQLLVSLHTPACTDLLCSESARRRDGPECCTNIGYFTVLDASLAFTCNLMRAVPIGKAMTLRVCMVADRMALLFARCKTGDVFVCANRDQEDTFGQRVGVMDVHRHALAGVLDRKGFESRFGVVSDKLLSVFLGLPCA